MCRAFQDNHKPFAYAKKAMYMISQLCWAFSLTYVSWEPYFEMLCFCHSELNVRIYLPSWFLKNININWLGSPLTFTIVKSEKRQATIGFGLQHMKSLLYFLQLFKCLFFVFFFLKMSPGHGRKLAMTRKIREWRVSDKISEPASLICVWLLTENLWLICFRILRKMKTLKRKHEDTRSRRYHHSRGSHTKKKVFFLPIAL